MKRHTYIRKLLPNIISILYSNEPRKDFPILDIGCNKYKIATRAIGLDCDSSVNPDVLGNALILPFKNNSFNLVTALELIEHFNNENQHHFLNEVYRILKVKGQFIVSTPNISDATRKVHDFLFFISHSLYDRKSLGKHIGELTHAQLKTMLMIHHFKVISEKAFSFFNYVVECEKIA